ncbi:DUF4760 domain-containing protein [Actinoplanes derwentensis]|nr:hypothetical protein [Actinoplanes derwentensis]
MQTANHVPFAIEMLTRDFGHREFQRLERLTLDQLPQHDPNGGVSGLPEPLQSQCRQVINFYDSIGIMVCDGAIREELVLATINYRLRRIWNIAGPFIRAEREHHRKGPFLDFLEHITARAHDTDPSEIAHRLGLHKMPTDTSTATPQETRDTENP